MHFSNGVKTGATDSTSSSISLPLTSKINVEISNKCYKKFYKSIATFHLRKFSEETRAMMLNSTVISMSINPTRKYIN